MTEKSKPVQHTPVHLRDDTPKVFDERHPAASAFAVAQPAAGVVADDVEAKGQNLAGGPTAEAAAETFSDQKEVLKQQHADNLQVPTPDPVVVDTEKKTAKPASSK